MAGEMADLASTCPANVTFHRQSVPTHAKYILCHRVRAASTAVFGGVNIGDRCAATVATVRTVPDEHRSRHHVRPSVGVVTSAGTNGRAAVGRALPIIMGPKIYCGPPLQTM